MRTQNCDEVNGSTRVGSGVRPSPAAGAGIDLDRFHGDRLVAPHDSPARRIAASIAPSLLWPAVAGRYRIVNDGLLNGRSAATMPAA